jgi:hypothetical protein
LEKDKGSTDVIRQICGASTQKEDVIINISKKKNLQEREDEEESL